MSATRLQLPVPVYARPAARRRALKLEVARLYREYSYPLHGVSMATVREDLTEILTEPPGGE